MFLKLPLPFIFLRSLFPSNKMVPQPRVELGTFGLRIGLLEEVNTFLIVYKSINTRMLKVMEEV